MQLTLDEISILCAYSAMVVYAIAFIAFAIDLARRGAAATAVADVPARADAKVEVAAAAGVVPATRGAGPAVIPAAGASGSWRPGRRRRLRAFARAAGRRGHDGAGVGAAPHGDRAARPRGRARAVGEHVRVRAHRHPRDHHGVPRRHGGREAGPAVPRHVRHRARARAARRRDDQLLREPDPAAAGAAVGVARDPRVRGVVGGRVLRARVRALGRAAAAVSA